ncbi:MAG: metallophosphoesterase [Prevotellaceae bacterium]|jgi:DNA repair exonuclease SbcCD nuclease subunit|nr:metallophosphoesterase [Prevotellaceae bacterium]
MNRKILLLAVFALMFASSTMFAQRGVKLRFAFATDVHLHNGYPREQLKGFQKALDKIKSEKVEFIIFGGDLDDIDGLSHNREKQTAENLYAGFKKIADETGIKYYPTIGNHDRYYDKDGGYVDGDEMFKAFFGKTYYTFENAGVRFFVINSVQHKKDVQGYVVGDEQMEWLKKELESVPATTPIVVSTHVPVYSMYYPVVEGKYVMVDVIANYKELLKVFDKHNLKLVLQGHQHLHEEMLLQGVHYVTGGAVSAAWWRGNHHGTEEGYLIVEVDKKNRFSWRYVDYGWEAK